MKYPSYQGQRVSEGQSNQGQRASEGQSYQGQRAPEDQSYQGQRAPSSRSAQRGAARSFRITLFNLSGRTLNRTNLAIMHGIFSGNGNDVPPEQVPSPARVVWESESDGFATGTEGSVTYATDAGEVFIHWNNPFVGSNGLGIGVPPPMTASNTNIDGDNVWCDVILMPKL
jgi:hypothetical protein